MKGLRGIISHYRKLSDREIMAETSNGILMGPRKPLKDKIEFKDLMKPERNFFSESEHDADYVSSFRFGHFNIPDIIAGSARGVSYIGGMNLGSGLIREGLVDDLESLRDFMVEKKLGILDVVSREEDEHLRMDVRVYECIECSGLPNIGRPICFFEAGIISGALSEILGLRVDAYERRCWTNGYSFCQFDVVAEP